MKYLLTIIGLCFLVACTALDDAQYADDIKLGAKVKLVECLDNYGQCSFDVVANCPYSATIVKGDDWLSFTENDASTISLKGHTTLTLSYTSNRGYRRTGRLVLSSGTRYDTLTVKQEGLYREKVSVGTKTLNVPEEGGRYSVTVTTNLLPKDFRFETVDTRDYPLEKKADDFEYENNVFSFRVLPSDSRDVKTFKVRIYALDDWGEKVPGDVTVTQQPGK